jgi:hypothetical protein
VSWVFLLARSSVPESTRPLPRPLGPTIHQSRFPSPSGTSCLTDSRDGESVGFTHRSYVWPTQTWKPQLESHGAIGSMVTSGRASLSDTGRSALWSIDCPCRSVDASGVVRKASPGRYHVDEIAAEPHPSGHTAQRWGSAIRHDDGLVIVDPDSWEVCLSLL